MSGGVVGSFRAATKQVNTTHYAHVRVESFPARGVTGVCEAHGSGAEHRLVGFSGYLETRDTMADSTSPALNRTLDTIGKCTGLTNYREWGIKVREAFGVYALDVLKVLNGTPRPEETDVYGVNAWKKADNNIYSILYFHTEGSANITCLLYTSPSPRD